MPVTKAIQHCFPWIARFLPHAYLRKRRFVCSIPSWNVHFWTLGSAAYSDGPVVENRYDRGNPLSPRHSLVILSVLSTSVTKQTGDMVYSEARRLRIPGIWAHTTMLYALERESDLGSTFAVSVELSEGRDVSSGPMSRVWTSAKSARSAKQPCESTGCQHGSEPTTAHRLRAQGYHRQTIKLSMPKSREQLLEYGEWF